MKKHPRSTTVCSMQPRRSAEAQAMARDRAGRDMEPPSSGSDATMVGVLEGSTHRPDYVGEANLYVPVAPHPVTGSPSRHGCCASSGEQLLGRRWTHRVEKCF